MAGLIPTRTDDPTRAAALLDRDGAAILTGRGTDAAAAGAIAGDVLGDLLARPDAAAVREGGEGDRSLIPPERTMPVHVDGFAYGDRHPDGLFLLCAQQGVSGGESMVVDGHHLLATVADDDPELFAFVHDEPVDLTEPGMRPTTSPIVLTLRSGRRALRRSPYMAPAPDAADPVRDQHLIDRWVARVEGAGAAAPRFALQPGRRCASTTTARSTGAARSPGSGSSGGSGRGRPAATGCPPAPSTPTAATRPSRERRGRRGRR